MDNIEFIKRNNLEELGKYFLNKGCISFLDGSYNVAYEFFKEGLNLITCDCSGWNQELKNSTNEQFNQLNIPENQQRAYLFCKGYLLSFLKSDKIKELYNALNAIEQYLEIEKDEFGYYVKGKVLHRLNRKPDSLQAFYDANNINSTSRTQYRIGRLVEEESFDFGLDLLFNSFKNNPSSSCCVRILKEFTNNSNIVIPSDKSDNNELLNSFNDIDTKPWKFGIEYGRLLNKDYSKENIDKVNSFVNQITKNSNMFIDSNDYNNYSHYDESYDDFSNPMDSEYYNDALDLDQQSPEFWDDI